MLFLELLGEFLAEIFIDLLFFGWFDGKEKEEKRGGQKPRSKRRKGQARK